MSDGRPLRMGTRASLLARTQSGHVAAALTKATGRAVEEVLVRTEGDQLSTEGRIPSAGDSVGVFVRALDDALRRDEIDFAVHSLKDVPTEYAEDLLMAAVPVRADVRDALVVASRHPARTVQELPQGARVATASPRRVAQLLRLRPDLDDAHDGGERRHAPAPPRGRARRRAHPRLRRPRPPLVRRADHAPHPSRRAPVGPGPGGARHLLPAGRRRRRRRDRDARRPARRARPRPPSGAS